MSSLLTLDFSRVLFEGKICSTIEVQSEISSLHLEHVAFDGVFIL